MQPDCDRRRFPRSVRMQKPDDFGLVLKSRKSIRAGRGPVSVCALTNDFAGRVRFGFTVGKSNVPLSVNRALVKRVMRECARHEIPGLRSECMARGVGLEVSLRWRSPLRDVGGIITVGKTKAAVRESTSACLLHVRRTLLAGSSGENRWYQGS